MSSPGNRVEIRRVGLGDSWVVSVYVDGETKKETPPFESAHAYRDALLTACVEAKFYELPMLVRP